MTQIHKYYEHVEIYSKENRITLHNLDMILD